MTVGVFVHAFIEHDRCKDAIKNEIKTESKAKIKSNVQSSELPSGASIPVT